MKPSEKICNEAYRRMDYLIEMYGINPNLGKYLKDGRVYYSYFTAGGMIGSIDSITYDPRYEKIVKDFEEEFGVYVYHCIEESKNTFVLLYIGSSEDEWEWQFKKVKAKQGTCIESEAYVYNFDEKFGEIGSVLIAAARDLTGNVTLMRIG